MIQDVENQTGGISREDFIGTWIVTSHQSSEQATTLPTIVRVFSDNTFSVSVNKEASGGAGVSMTYGDWKLMEGYFFLRSNYLVYLEIPGGSMVEHFAKGYARGQVTQYQHKMAMQGEFVDVRHPLDLRDVGVAEEDAFDLGAREIISGVFKGEKVPEVMQEDLPEALHYLLVWD